jgi:hypothetical protein
MTNPPCWKPAVIAIVVYRRSWSESFCAFEAKTQKRPHKIEHLWKVPQLRKSLSVACGSFFFMISTSCLESTKRFPHFPQGPAIYQTRIQWKVRKQIQTCYGGR